MNDQNILTPAAIARQLSEGWVRRWTRCSTMQRPKAEAKTLADRISEAGQQQGAVNPLPALHVMLLLFCEHTMRPLSLGHYIAPNPVFQHSAGWQQFGERLQRTGRGAQLIRRTYELCKKTNYSQLAS